MLPIASLTKMMTALVVVDRAPPDAKVRVTKEALAYKGSAVGVLPKGKRIKLETMLNGLLLPSGNDAAIALAQRMSGTVARFVQRMNERAGDLGLACTRYSSPDGFEDAGNHSCAIDLAEMARAVLDQPRLARIVRRRRAVLPFPIKGGRIYLFNNNPLLRTGYPGTIGDQDRLHRRRRALPGRGRAAQRPPAGRGAAALARPRQAGDEAARPRLRAHPLGRPVGHQHGQVARLPAQARAQAGVAQPAEQVGHGLGQVEALVERGDDVGRILGEDDVGEHEAPAGRERGGDARDEVGLVGALEVVNRERREDQVEGTLGQRCAQVLQAQVGGGPARPRRACARWSPRRSGAPADGAPRTARAVTPVPGTARAPGAP